MREVLSKADFVSIHCPGGKATHHLIDQEAISMMQPHAFLVNTARGDVIDETALVTALINQEIAGAALDVYEYEPKVSNALVSMENVVLLLQEMLLLILKDKKKLLEEKVLKFMI